MTGEIMRLAIDGNEANQMKRVGSNAYAYGILAAMEKITAPRAKQVQVTVLLASEPVADLPAPRNGWRYRVVGPRTAWTQWGLPIYLFVHQSEYDVFFTPGHYAPRWCALPYVSSVMDLAFLRFPELFRTRDLYQLENWTRYSVKHAAKVVAISRFTKKEVEKFYGLPGEDVIVAYPALVGKVLRLSAASQRQVLRDLRIKNNYFLYLGTLQPRKNIILMIDAFTRLTARRRYRNYQLVLAGKNGWLTDEINRKIENCPVSKQIIQTGFISEVQKAALLANATATLNLGLYEGFGIPPLESLSYGTVPIVAGNTALPEAVGAAGLSVDPYSLSSVVKAMSVAAHMTGSARDKFLRLAARQVKRFGYEKSASVILAQLIKIGRQEREA